MARPESDTHVLSFRLVTLGVHKDAVHAHVFDLAECLCIAVRCADQGQSQWLHRQVLPTYKDQSRAMSSGE